VKYPQIYIPGEFGQAQFFPLRPEPELKVCLSANEFVHGFRDTSQSAQLAIWAILPQATLHNIDGMRPLPP